MTSHAVPALELVVLDVNETLFPLTPIAARFAAIGLDGQLELWFARILRDGFAAAAAGTFASFRDLAEHHLRVLIHQQGRSTAHAPGAAGATDAGDPIDDAVATVLGGFAEVAPHPDVLPGLRKLHAGGIPTVALTNGSAEITQAFLDRHDLGGLVAAVHDVSSAARWKPAPDPYRWVLEQHDVEAAAAAMVAVHPWDLFGAGRAGLRTGWIDRAGTGHYPAPFGQPDVAAPTFDALVTRLLRTGPASG